MPTIFIVFEMGDSREPNPGSEVAVAEGVDVGESREPNPGSEVAVAEGVDVGESREPNPGLEVAVAEGVDVGVAPGRTRRLLVQLNSSQSFSCQAHH